MKLYHKTNTLISSTFLAQRKHFGTSTNQALKPYELSYPSPDSHLSHRLCVERIGALRDRGHWLWHRAGNGKGVQFLSDGTVAGRGG